MGITIKIKKLSLQSQLHQDLGAQPDEQSKKFTAVRFKVANVQKTHLFQ